ncbi:MAG TPA: metallophosphoesterase, partial [Thermoplasmata archaeon]|nr:metallophosphoesterase [Thermoplasmata archaeon]
VTREMVEALLGSGGMEVSRSGAVLARHPGAPADGPQPGTFSLIADGFAPGPPGRAPLEAYGALFASRFHQLERILRGRSDLPNVRRIAELGPRGERTASVIGMVREVRRTPAKNHVILTVEDESGPGELLVPHGSAAAAGVFLPDEVVGLTVRTGTEPGRIPLVTGVVRPDVAISRSVRRSEVPHAALFLSDLHIGSRSFLDGPWSQLIEFLREKGPNPELARRIAHVVIAGDLVDGIGIYPNQERDLAIGDIYEQYRELARRLAELPDRLQIVVLPGNHDAVCPAEPQPALPKGIETLLPSNVHSVGNPSTFALDGVVIEAYHGRGFDDLIPAIPGASYSRPTEVMKRMLAMRHLAPIYGGRTPLAPLPRDGLVIDPTPEILVTGHAHTFGIDQYRGVLLLNASTWQAETEYQRMRNITPVPARAAVVDLTDLSAQELDFSGARAVVPGAAE